MSSSLFDLGLEACFGNSSVSFHAASSERVLCCERKEGWYQISGDDGSATAGLPDSLFLEALWDLAASFPEAENLSIGRVELFLLQLCRRAVSRDSRQLTRNMYSDLFKIN